MSETQSLSYSDFYATLTPCSSNMTLLDYVPRSLEEDDPLQVPNPLLTLVLPDLVSRVTVPFSDVFTYARRFVPSLAASHITIFHLLVYLYEEKKIDAQYISQIRLLSMGKPYCLSSMVDLAFPPCFLDSYTLLSIASRSSVFQVSIIPFSKHIPLKVSPQTAVEKLAIISGTLTTAQNDSPLTYADAIAKQFSRVRSSISSESGRHRSTSVTSETSLPPHRASRTSTLGRNNESSTSKIPKKSLHKLKQRFKRSVRNFFAHSSPTHGLIQMTEIF